jgi:hypothetical protein
MWRILFLFSALPIAAALLARWFFGMRVLATVGTRPCRCDLNTWMPLPNDSAAIHRNQESAAEFGQQLLHMAIIEWQQRDPKAAAARGNSKRFGAVVPPLTAIVVILAVFVAKIPPMNAIAILLVATALAATLNVLSLAPELAAITHTIKNVRAKKNFPNRDDEDAVIQCAIAHAWKGTLPPMLAALQK